MRRSDALYFTGYMWDTEVQKDAITRAITVAKPAGARVVFDVADPFAVERYRDDFLALIREHVDIVFANRREAGILLGEKPTIYSRGCWVSTNSGRKPGVYDGCQPARDEATRALAQAEADRETFQVVTRGSERSQAPATFRLYRGV